MGAAGFGFFVRVIWRSSVAVGAGSVWAVLSGAGQITANSVPTAVEFSSGNIKVHAGGSGTTDFVIDITGIWII